MQALQQRFSVILLFCRRERTVLQFLADHPKVRFHFTPTYSSWLNQVELWFAKIQRDLLARGIFTSVADLARKIRKYIRAYANVARPFRWSSKLTYWRLTSCVLVKKMMVKYPLPSDCGATRALTRKVYGVAGCDREVVGIKQDLLRRRSRHVKGFARRVGGGLHLGSVCIGQPQPFRPFRKSRSFLTATSPLSA